MLIISIISIFTENITPVLFAHDLNLCGLIDKQQLINKPYHVLSQFDFERFTLVRDVIFKNHAVMIVRWVYPVDTPTRAKTFQDYC